jgi:hypothetical protein
MAVFRFAVLGAALFAGPTLGLVRPPTGTLRHQGSATCVTRQQALKLAPAAAVALASAFSPAAFASGGATAGRTTVSDARRRSGA